MLLRETTLCSYRPVADRRSLRDVEDELATLAGQLAVGMCRWLELLGEFDRRAGWSGWASCGAWLAWRCGLTARTAREHVRVAQALPDLPSVRAAFASGEISYAKVRALCRVATSENEDALLELARELTASQLERALRVYRRCSTAEARDLHEQETLTWRWDEDGSLVIRGRLAPEDGALLLQALEVARQGLWKDGREAARGSAEPDLLELRPTRVDALVAVAEASLAHEAGLRGGGDRFQVVVHVDEAALQEGGDGACLLEEGPAVAAEIARRLACDAAVVRIAERPPAPLDVGRKTRRVSWPLRRALRERDGGCRYPGCENRRFLDAHHVRHWADGGETSLDNLVLLCRRHHRALHEGGFSIDRQGRFLHRHGWVIHAVPVSPRESTGSFGVLDVDIGPRTPKTASGEPMNVSLALQGLFDLEEAA